MNMLMLALDSVPKRSLTLSDVVSPFTLNTKKSKVNDSHDSLQGVDKITACVKRYTHVFVLFMVFCLGSHLCVGCFWSTPCLFLKRII